MLLWYGFLFLEHEFDSAVTTCLSFSEQCGNDSVFVLFTLL